MVDIFPAGPSEPSDKSQSMLQHIDRVFSADAIERARWLRGKGFLGLCCHSGVGSQFTLIRSGNPSRGPGPWKKNDDLGEVPPFAYEEFFYEVRTVGSVFARPNAQANSIQTPNLFRWLVCD